MKKRRSENQKTSSTPNVFVAVVHVFTFTYGELSLLAKSYKSYQKRKKLAKRKDILNV